MAGDDDDVKIPTEFSECVSREELEATNKLMMEKMEETVHKSVHDALIAMKLGKTYERMDRQLSEIVDRIAVLEKLPPPPPSRFPDDAVFDEHGNYDEAYTRDLRLRHRLRQNTEGMGFGAPHCQQGNNNHAPDDLYAKIKFTIPSFSGNYDAEGYLDWEMTID